MKKLMILTIIALFTVAGKTDAKTIVRTDIDVDFFYSSLEPYGEWLDVGYGDFVWRPYNSDYDWSPYADGRWEWTRHGWYWVSYEPFGWATYHYGRWYYDDYYGWLWMPDSEWGPAWVEWRYDDVYVGWAPLPPYAKFNWRSGIYFSISWHSAYNHWNFVQYNHFVSHNIHTHFVHKNYVKNIFNSTKYRTNYFADNNRIVNGGVSRRLVERKIGRKLNTKIISRTEKYNNYNSRDIKTRKGIVDYRPSERSVNNATFDKTRVTKGRTLTSLKNDKIVLNKRNSSTQNVEMNRNSSNNTRTIQKSSSERSKNQSYRSPVSTRNSSGMNKQSTSRKVTNESAKNNYSREKSSTINKSTERTPTVREKTTTGSSSSSSSRKSTSNNNSESKREVVKKR